MARRKKIEMENGEIIETGEIVPDDRDRVMDYLVSLPDACYLAYIAKTNAAREAAAREKRLRRK